VNTLIVTKISQTEQMKLKNIRNADSFAMSLSNDNEIRTYFTGVIAQYIVILLRKQLNS